MAIGIVSPSDFDKESEKQKKHESVIKELPVPGRKPGDNNVPESVRKLIGEEANVNGRSAAVQLADAFGISKSSVSAYTAGATSTSSRDADADLLKHIKEAKRKTADKARIKLNKALESITDDKLESASLKDLAVVAKSMSGVIKDMEPPAEQVAGINATGPTFVLYSPAFKKEESFETITVSD